MRAPLTSHLPLNLEESFSVFQTFPLCPKAEYGGERVREVAANFYFVRFLGGASPRLSLSSKLYFSPLLYSTTCLLPQRPPLACTHVVPRFAEKKQLLRKKKESSLKITVSIYYLFCFKSKMALIFPPTSGKRNY